MRSIYAALFLLLPLLSAAENIHWPDLSTIKHVSGRSAIEADLQSGAAAFTVPYGTPVSITIPQYAMYRDLDSGRLIPVVVVQAEVAQGLAMFGAIEVASGKHLIGQAEQFKLLGQVLTQE